jgi:hypothetical protein
MALLPQKGLQSRKAGKSNNAELLCEEAEENGILI